jgi:polysaccharide export outer membrane protein
MTAWRFAALSLVLCVLAPSIVRANADYIIHVGDQLQVMVFGSQGVTAIQLPIQAQPATIAALSQAVTVLGDGTITYPLIGSIPVAGLTPDAAGKRITAALAEYVRHPTVSVLVEKGVMPTVKVLGSVDHGGQLDLQEGDRLADAIAKAGVSPNSYADLNHITLNRIVDGVPRVYNVNLYNLLLNADFSADPVLQAGDIVYVPKAKQVNLSNYINLPFGLYYLYLLLTPGVNHNNTAPVPY